MTNIYNRKISFGSECREKIMQGVNGLADAVAVTLGPKGKTVIIKLGYHDPKITKDGVSVAKEVFFPDPMVNMGAEILSGVSLRTAQRCGDGSSTATVLARALLMAGGEIDMAQVDAVEAAVRAASKPMDGYGDWYNVALVSSNGDTEVAGMIADCLTTLGLDGQVTIELTSEVKPVAPAEGGVHWYGTHLKSEIVAGMSLARGYCSPYFVTNTQKMTVELDNPVIAVLDKNLITLETVFDTLNAVAKQGRSLLIIAREIGGDALQTLILNKVKNGVRVAAVSASGLTNDFLEDVCVSVGASLTENKLGAAKKVVIHHNKTIIVEGAGDSAEVEARCTMLRENKVKDRLARLSGGIGVLWVGGNTEAEASERRDRVDDALNATRSAIEEGIVGGGGTALYWAGRTLPEGAVRTATEAPIRQILKNAGLDADEILSKMENGYDARLGEYCDMVERGILDPTKVVCSALRDAASVATLVNNTEAAIVEGVEE